jgi:peptidoglycan/LPS O-acetylase OafA/YrhL
MEAPVGAGLVLPPGAFRLLLAAAVMAAHLSRLDVGRLAVLLFFFLSGYWVAKIWREKFDARDLPRFYASRYFRIMPLYLIVLVAVALLTGAGLRAQNLLLFGVATARHDPLGIAWSLDIEMQFYVLLPLLVLLAVKLPRALLALMTLMVAVAGWIAYDRYEISTVAQYLPVFALGVMTHVADWKPSLKAAHRSLASFAVWTAVFAIVPATRPFLDGRIDGPINQDIFSFFWLAPLLPYVAHSLTLRSSRLDRRLGDLSYPLYLVHWPLIAAAKAQFGESLATKAGVALVALAVALALYGLVDRPIDALRVRLFEPKRPQAA